MFGLLEERGETTRVGRIGLREAKGNGSCESSGQIDQKIHLVVE